VPRKVLEYKKILQVRVDEGVTKHHPHFRFFQMLFFAKIVFNGGMKIPQEISLIFSTYVHNTYLFVKTSSYAEFILKYAENRSPDSTK